MDYVYQRVVRDLEQALHRITQAPDIQLDIPKNTTLGDITTNVAMRLASQKKQAPLDIAKEIIADLTEDERKSFSHIEAVAPGFINFFIDPALVAAEVKEIDERYGSQQIKQQKIVIEYSSPNTNKPLHVGHLRNNALGMSMANILRFLGAEVVTTEVVNDRGIAIMKSLLAYQRWGNGETPEDADLKGDALVGKYYVLFSQKAKEDPGLLDQAQELLLKWEQGDPEVRALWEQLNEWVYQGWFETYKQYGSEFDVRYYESQLYDKGKEIIQGAVEQGLAYKRDDGAIVVDLSDAGLGGRDTGEKVLLRSDGTTVYMTQDIYLAENRYQDYHFDNMIYIVGQEQKYHFEVLFAILQKLDRKWVGELEHYWYGHVLLPHGKMKSREGTVVDADELLDEMYEKAFGNIVNSKFVQENKSSEHIAKVVSLAAIKYWFLKNNQKTEIIFNPEKALDFEGNSGPYILYTYVRLGSILDKSLGDFDINIDVYSEQEKTIVRTLILWPEIVKNFAHLKQHNLICEYLFTLSQILNSYYHDTPILKAESTELQQARLALIAKARTVISIGLDLLNIEKTEKM